MSLVNVSNIFVKNTTAPFLAPFSFTIVVETLKQLKDPIDFKFVYIGSAKADKYDQVLDTFEVGPLPPGVGQFDCEINAPDASKIPTEDLLGVTAMMVIVSFKGKEFFRVGYYIYNNLPELEQVEGAPIPSQLDLNRIQRSILADKPKILNYSIDWEEQEKNMMLITDMLGGTQGPLKDNQNFLNFSDSSINFNGMFSDIKQQNGDQNGANLKPAQNNTGFNNPFDSFSGGMFSNTTNKAGTGAPESMNNGPSQFSMFSSPYSGNGTQYQQEMMACNNMNAPNQQQSQSQIQQPFFDTQRDSFNSGNNNTNQPQQQLGPSFGLFAQNYQ